MSNLIELQKNVAELQKLLKRSRQSFLNVIEKAIIAICITDDKGMFVYVNKGYRELYGYTKKELIGQHFTVVVPTENQKQLYDLHESFIAGGAEPRGEWSVVTKSGQQKTILADAVRIEDVYGLPQKVTYIMDITDRKNQERALAQAYEHLHADAEKAYRIVQQLLPESEQRQQDLEIAFHNRPASLMGGDFGVVQRIDDHHLFFAVVDVSGHGLDAALLNIFVKSAIDQYLQVNRKKVEPIPLLKKVHESFLRQGFPEEYYICILCAVYDERTNVISIANAGIQVPILIKKQADYEANSKSYNKAQCNTNKLVKQLIINGMPIMHFVSSDLYKVDSIDVKLEIGDVLMMATDGLLETRNAQDEMYGIERMQELIGQTIDTDQQGQVFQLSKKIEASYLNYCGDNKLDDDITYLILQRCE